MLEHLRVAKKKVKGSSKTCRQQENECAVDDGLEEDAELSDACTESAEPLEDSDHDTNLDKDRSDTDCEERSDARAG